ncbi:hypothetical protein GCM10010187_30580 [Actinomadura coerulea]|nr:hypothetical protein GCM10010187_30580 [Actinomadura coerulea]
MRGVSPISASAAVMRPRSTWLVWSSRKDRSVCVRAGAIEVMRPAYPRWFRSRLSGSPRIRRAGIRRAGIRGPGIAWASMEG